MAKTSSKSTRTARAPKAPRLVDVLRALPSRELKSLISRVGIQVDAGKRIDVPEQVGRALVSLPDRDLSSLPGPTRELLYRIAEAKGALVVEALPPAIEPLVARGLVFARAAPRAGVELILPIAHLLHLRSWEGEDPRGMRALLSQVSVDVASGIASHYLGRPATPPVALALEAAWEELMDPEALRRGVESLAPLERKLLEAIERVGGEVETEELLDLEREPMRLRGATGATPSRRGVGFALERRAFLVPLHPNRHVVPTEVAEIVGARAAADRDKRRSEIKSFVLEDDHAPRRARFADDPVPLALAMAMTIRESGLEVRPGLGTPRSLVTKFATRFGRDPSAVSLIAALSRAVGLWDPSVLSVTAPPGMYQMHELGRLLFEAWRRGGAWDEARPDGELLRVSVEQREASAVGVIRTMVLEALRELGEGRWVPWEAVAAYVRTDRRAPGVTRLLERWAVRCGFDAATPAEVARQVSFHSLHLLGVVDLGDPDDDDEGDFGPTLRLTPRGRGLIGAGEPPEMTDRSRFIDNQALRLGSQTRLGHVVALAPFVEVGRVSGHLDVVVTQASLSKALGAGFEGDVISARLSAIAPLPDPIARLLVQASAVVGRTEFVPSEGFLWVEDPEVRELLRTRRQTADLFVDPSPPSGLLITAGVDIERLARRCRSLGVEVIVDGEVYRTHSQPPPRSRSSGALRAVTTSSGSSSKRRKASGTRAKTSRSSGSIRAQKRGGGSGGA